MYRRRIALFNGACGTASRLLIQGQVADVFVAESPDSGKWDPFLSLPGSQVFSIRPISDLGLPGIRRPRIVLEIIDHPGRDATPEVLYHSRVLYRSIPLVGDERSFFSHKINGSVPPGHYSVRAILLGHKSIRQRIFDLLNIRTARRTGARKKGSIIGYGKVRILPEDYDGYLITSDIDQTFLDTNIKTRGGLLETLFERPDQKRPLPGMTELYRQIRHDPKDPVPLMFVSASPHFFRRSFQALFYLQGIDYTGLSLKPMITMFEFVLRRTFGNLNSVEELISTRLARVMEKIASMRKGGIKKLSNQVAYKLAILLENRLMQPTHAKEILMGDNTESDYLIFTLYQIALSGIVDDLSWKDYLSKLRFQNHNPMAESQVKRIQKLSSLNREIHGNTNPVHEVWINLAFDNPDRQGIKKRLMESLPDGVSLEDDRIAFPGGYPGAAGFALRSLEKGLLNESGAALVFQSLLESRPGKNGNEDRIRSEIEFFKPRNKKEDQLKKDLLKSFS